MTAQEKALAPEDSAFDNIQSWLDQGHGDRPPRQRAKAMAADLHALQERIARVRRLSAACAGVELSPYVKNLVKMVGSLELLAPPSEWS